MYRKKFKKKGWNFMKKAEILKKELDQLILEGRLLSSPTVVKKALELERSIG